MKARGSLATRLGRLEERTATISVPAESEPRDEAEWLIAFERRARDRPFEPHKHSSTWCCTG